MAYPTVVQCKTFLGAQGDGDDALLTQVLAAAVKWVEEWCGHVFVKVTGTSVYIVPAYPNLLGRGRSLLVREHDVYKITQITNGDGEIVAATDYLAYPVEKPPFYRIELSPVSGLVWTRGDDGLGQVVILGDMGATSTCPSDVFYAIMEIVAFYYRSRSSGAAGPLTTATRQGLVINPSQVPPHALELLVNWRRRRG